MLFKRLLLLVLIIVAVQLQVRLWIGEGSFAQVSGLNEKVETNQARIEIKQQRNKVLLAETRELKQGLESIEEMARTELGMIKSGETFFLILDDDR